LWDIERSGRTARSGRRSHVNSRALKRGEAGFPVDEAVDILIAPICYRILFSSGEISPDYVTALLGHFARLNGVST
jgi:hypothetical protein